jgi:outer membrane lipoprotein carrier protein
MVKKVIALLLCSFSVLAAPQDKQELSRRLALTEGFSAQFKQQVISPDGVTVVHGTGSVDIARPSLFRWSTQGADENLLVSNGKTLWYYSPFIEQVTIYDQAEATEKTPFVLLTRNKQSDWDNYTVEAKGDEFILTPIAKTSTQGKFHIKIDQKGIVNGFDIIEQDGQKSLFTFDSITLTKPNKNLFTFTIPDGVEVDDQRH